MSAEPFRGVWNCAICRQRRRGMGWGRELADRTAFLRWDTDYSRLGRYHIVAQWLEAGTRICRFHESAAQQLEERHKIKAAGDAAYPDALEDEIEKIERILDDERKQQIKREAIRELDRLMSAVDAGLDLRTARDASREIRKHLEQLVP